MRYSNGIETREESYWFGFLIGDGNLARNRNRITVVLQKRDYNHLLKLKSFFEGEGQMGKHSGGYPKYTIERKELANNLRKIGLEPGKTYTLNWKAIPYDYTADFLRGLLDADGTAFLKFPMAVMRWYGTESLMHGIRDYLEAHEICTPLPRVRRDKGCSYNFGVSGRWKVQALSEYLWLNATVYLQRKYDTVQSLKGLNKTHPRERGRFNSVDIQTILDLSQRKSQTEIARMFGVSNSMISRIVSGQRYSYRRSTL